MKTKERSVPGALWVHLCDNSGPYPHIADYEQGSPDDVKYVREDIAMGLFEALKSCTKDLNYPEIDSLVWPTLHKAYRAIAKAEEVLDY